MEKVEKGVENLFVLRDDRLPRSINVEAVPTFENLIAAAVFLLEAIRYCVHNEIRLACYEGHNGCVPAQWGQSLETGKMEIVAHSRRFFQTDENKWYFCSCCSDIRLIKELVDAIFPVVGHLLPFVEETDDYNLSVTKLKNFIEHGFIDSVEEAKVRYGDKWRCWIDPR